MQQERVLSDNKKLRKLLRDKISSNLFTSSYPFVEYDILSFLEDFYLPSIIYFYYESKSNNFVEYLSGIDLTKGNYKHIYSRIENGLNTIRNLNTDLSEKDLRLLGDLHPSFSTKIKTKGFVRYKDYPDYQNVLERLSSEIFKDYDKYFPKTERKEKFFFREYIPVNDNANEYSSIEEFYYNLGRIIPFLIMIRAVDINAENVLVNLPYPVFFDLETIFSPNFSDFLKEYSIENTGFISMYEQNDNSLLTGGIKDRDSLLKPIIIEEKGQPSIAWRTRSKGEYSNIPELNNKKVHPRDYIKYIKEGYFNTVEGILSKKELFKRIVSECDAYTRVVLRPTRIYRLIMFKSCYPQVYLSSDVKEYINNCLSQYPTIYNIHSNGLEEDEVDTISNLQVPVYYSSLKSSEVINSSGKCVGKLSNTQYDSWVEYINNIISLDYYNQQFNTLEKSLY